MVVAAVNVGAGVAGEQAAGDGESGGILNTFIILHNSNWTGIFTVRNGSLCAALISCIFDNCDRIAPRGSAVIILCMAYGIRCRHNCPLNGNRSIAGFTFNAGFAGDGCVIHCQFTSLRMVNCSIAGRADFRTVLNGNFSCAHIAGTVAGNSSSRFRVYLTADSQLFARVLAENRNAVRNGSTDSNTAANSQFSGFSGFIITDTDDRTGINKVIIIFCNSGNSAGTG